MRRPSGGRCAAGPLRVAGLMSGTSADGVDVAIVDFRRGRVKVRAFGTRPYPRDLREAVLRLCRPALGRIDDLCHLNFALGEFFAESLRWVCRRRGVPLASVDLIGSHGQTVCHLPEGRLFRGRRIGSTLQIGEPCVIAERTGITTVADLRPRDVAAGGQGAPLVPYADYVLFSHPRRSRAIQNIGGIANVTYLPAGGVPADCIAFDTGPGNMVIDRIVERLTAGKKTFDAGGRMAAQGKVEWSLAAELMRNPYFLRSPPKSTGRELFGAAYADRLLDLSRRRGVAGLDLLATVTWFTAASIAHAYRLHLRGPVDEVILCGGGARNALLVRWLERLLRPADVLTTDDFGIDADAKEAVAFAILARETVCGRPANVPSATGAGQAVVLGKIIPGAVWPPPWQAVSRGRRRSTR